MGRINYARQSRHDAGRAAVRAERCEGAVRRSSGRPPAWSPVTRAQAHRLGRLARSLGTAVPDGLTVAQASDLIQRWQRRLADGSA
jgi:hypothetical protein